MGKRCGAPDKYSRWLTEEGLARLELIAKHSKSKGDIARQLDVNVATLNQWIRRFDAIANAVKKTEPIIIRELEDSLGKLCNGFTQVVNGKEVYFPPNPTAIIFTLKNKDSAHYRDRREVELSGNVGISDAIAQAVSRAEAADSDT